MRIEQKTITSIEVAEMVGKDHSKLLRDIRTYHEQLGQAKIGQSEFFQESKYVNSQNKDMPCYMVTKKGCEFIGNKLTGVKGTEFTAKYINRFHGLEDEIKANLSQLPPSLQIAQQLLNQMIQQEISIAEAKQQSQKAIETTQAIKDTIIGVYDDWRAEIKHLVSSIQRGSNQTYSDTWNMLYEELVYRAHCDLSRRIDNGRFRLRESGATKTKIEAFGRLDVIEADPKLKEIFTTIVKEYAIKYVA